MATKKVNIDIIAKDKTKAALSRVQGSLNNVKKSVFSLKGALVGLGAGAVVKSFVDVGREIESLETRFKFLFGSAKEGAIAFDNLTTFASKVPFSLQEISRASGNLAVVADDAQDLNRILEITGNVAAVTGLDFETTASQIQRAFSGGIGAADLFRERGVRALLGFDAGVQVTAEQTIARFEELFAGNGRFAKATDDLSKTLDGTLSMIRDSFFKFQTAVAKGFFTELKKEFGDLDKFLKDNEESIEDIATAIGENFAGAITKTSKAIKDVAPAVKSIADALGTTITGFQSLPTFVQSSGIIAALLFGKKGLVAFGAVSFLVGQIQDLISEAKTVSELKLLDPSQIDNIEELNLLIKQFKKERADIVADMRDPDNVIPLDVLEKEFNDVNASIEKLQKRVQSIHLNEIMIEQMEEFEKQLGHSMSNVSKSSEEAAKAIKLVEHEVFNIKKASKELLAENEKTFETIRERNKTELQLVNERVKEELAIVEESKRALETLLMQQVIDQELTQEMANSKLLDGMREFEKLKTMILQNGNADRQKLIDEDARRQAELMKRNYDEQLNHIKNRNFQELELDKLSSEQKKDLVFATGREVLDELSKTSKKAFQINKALAIADAVVSTARGVTKALGMGPFGVPLAVAIGALGAAQIATIASTKYQGRRLGGRMNQGQPYIVGEAGPEMVVPDRASNVIPNNQLGGGQPVTVNFNINTVDARGFNELLVNSRGVIVNMINSAVNEKGKAALI